MIVTLSFTGYGSYAPANQTSTFESTLEGIRFQYPTYWGNLTYEQGCINNLCGIPINYNETEPRFSFMIMKLTNETSGFECYCNDLVGFMKMMYGKVSSEDGFSFIADNQTSVGGYPAWQFEYSGLNADGLPAKKFIISTLVNNTFYVILYNPVTADSPIYQLPELRKLVDTVEFFLPQVPIAKLPSFINPNETEKSIPETSIDNNPSGLQILSHNSYIDSIGHFHVIGEVKNNTPSIAQFVQVTGTFYDGNNKVVGTQFTYTNPSNIDGGEKAPFEITLLSASVPISQIDHYNLIVNSK